MRNLFRTTPYEKYKEIHVVNLIRWKTKWGTETQNQLAQVRESREIFIIRNLQNYYLAVTCSGPHTKHFPALYYINN